MTIFFSLINIINYLLGGHWALVLTWDPPPQGTLHLDQADQEDEGGGGVVRMLD